MTSLPTAVDRADEAPRAVPLSGRLAYIDGVRAIAIIAVVAFHAHIPGFRGGFVGVDVFFVISGFLITHQIASQSLAGRFSAADFYARRVLRIFPPLLFVTLATLALSTAFPLLPQESRELSHSAAATAAMISNYYFTQGTEYFAVRSEINPLLHTWSLGVEEQYYLLAPAFTAAIIAFAARRNWRPTGALLGCGVIAIVGSYITLAILTKTDHRLAFFSIMSRSWQFALGGMLSIAILDGYTVPARWRSALGLAGFLAIAGSVTLYHEHMSYPGFAAALAPSFGALLLLASGLRNEAAPLTRMLASRPAVAIGLLSYSWYLWHWPLTELARTLPFGQDSVWKDVASSTVALALSVPTYLWLEQPMKALRRPDITQRFGGRIVAAGVAGSVLIAVFALLLARSPAFNRELPAIDMGKPTANLAGCREDAGLPKFSHIVPCVVGGDGAPSVAFWGDSHALMLQPIAEWSARAAGRTAVVFGNSSCPPLPGIEVDYFVYRTCASNNDEVLTWLRGQQAHPLTGIVLAARWSFYNGKDTPAGDAELPHAFWRDATRRNDGFTDMLGASLDSAIRTLGADRRVLIVGPAPELRHSATDCMIRAKLNGQSPEVCAIDRSTVVERHRDTMTALGKIAAAFPNVRLIDPTEVFCERNTCRPFGPQGVYYDDKDHLSPLGAELLYRHFQRDFAWVYGDAPAK